MKKRMRLFDEFMIQNITFFKNNISNFTLQTIAVCLKFTGIA